MNLLEFLKEIGMSQTQLASELDVTPSSVNLWVNGKGNPSFNCCRQLFLMGMSVEDLFDVNYNEIHHLVKEDREPTEISEDAFRLRWMKMMQEWNEQQH